MGTTADCRVSLVTSVEEFEALGVEWSGLGETNMFLSHAWMFRWWEDMSDPETDRLRLILVHDKTDRLLGVAPFYRHRRLSHGPVLAMLGNGAACSDYLSLITAPGFESVVGQAVGQYLISDGFHYRSGRTNMIELEGVCPRDSAIAALVAQLQPSGWLVDSDPLESCWRVDLPPTWEAMRQGASKSIRRKINKAVRRLEDSRIEFEVIQDASSIESHWADFVQLHQLRRNQLGQPGCFADPRFESFLKRATLQLADQGRVVVCFATFEGRAFATMLCFRWEDCLCMYQTGADPEFAKWEPGHLMNTFTLKCAIEAGYHQFDFLRGDEPYKRRWGAEPAPLVRHRLIAPDSSARIRHNLFSTGRSVWRWVRSSIPVSQGGARAC